jgi:hypothetical protein
MIQQLREILVKRLKLDTPGRGRKERRSRVLNQI